MRLLLFIQNKKSNSSNTRVLLSFIFAALTKYINNKNMKLWKYSGTFLTATGIIHTIYALFIGKDAFSEMLRNGLVNSIGENYSQGFAFWFLTCGIILILLGQTLQYYIRKEQKPAPVFLGYSILLLTIIGCIIEPVSGFWLFCRKQLLLFIQIKNRIVISFKFEKRAGLCLPS